MKTFYLSVVIGVVLAEIEAALDDSREPIHKEVLMRMLSYYEIRSETLRLGVVLTKTNAAQLTTATHRRKQ